MKVRCLLVEVLVRPERIHGFSLGDWDLLIRQARAAFLLARLQVMFGEHGMVAEVPEQPKRHLEGARIVADQLRAAVLREVGLIRDALGGDAPPLVFLKGAAYILADLPVAKGRTLSDIDFMVPKSALPDVEADLMLAGWVTGAIDAYDERYYRTWMHEIPPMRHIKRGTTIDVHHAILPETARIRADSQKMRTAAAAVREFDGVAVFSPADMVLHSATHLFHEGELEKGLRDLTDIDLLLRDYAGRRADFWDELLARGREVGLERPLFYALRYAARMLETPVPARVLTASAAGGPPRPLRWLMDALYLRALRPYHKSCSDWIVPIARRALYVRGHWLRMPLPLLLVHLARKAWVARQAVDAQP